jgi:polysaccharide export outer membrane protein
MKRALYLCAWTFVLAISGCHILPKATIEENYVPPEVLSPVHPASFSEMPRELSKVSLPTYRVEPPDVLVIEALNIVPKVPYHLRTADVLTIQVQGAFPDAPIDGPFSIEPGGSVNLGVAYGTVIVAGKTIEEAEATITQKLKEALSEPIVSVSLLQMAGLQQIAGDHLVKPDGTVLLGSYGSVRVVGMTISEVKQAVEAHLSEYLDHPEISVDVLGFNSKVYYIVTEGAGLGDTLASFPVTGNETVLDALSQIGGLTQLSSTRIWIARPTPYSQDVQILPVDWKAITAQGSTSTNYQILPGDRVFIAENQLVALDTRLGKLLAPVERVFGFSVLGVGTLSRFSGKVLQNNGGGNLTGGF